MGHFCDEPALFDDSVPCLLEHLTTRVATHSVTVDLPTSNWYSFFDCPAPVLVGLAAAPAALSPIVLAVVSPAFLMATDQADAEAAEPQALEQPQLLTQIVRFPDNFDDYLNNDTLLLTRSLRETPTCIHSAKPRLPAEAIPTYRQSLRCSLSQLRILNIL